MLIYRVESFSGKGAYGLPVGFQGNTLLHPLPWEDKKLAPFWKAVPSNESGKYFFGFGSMAQLERWFDADDRKVFAEYNERRCATDDNRVGVSAYDCLEEDCFVGDTQAVFIKKRAQWLEFQPFVMAKELVA